jgi:hypothetical protein
MTQNSTQIKFLDLDEVKPAIDLTVRLGGVDHKLKPISVEDFVANTQDQRKLSSASSLEEEVDVVLRMLVRSFPTMNIEDLRKVDLAKLWKLLEFANETNGSKEIEAETKESGENPQTAG